MKNRMLYNFIYWRLLFSLALLVGAMNTFAQSAKHPEKIKGISFNGPEKAGLEDRMIAGIPQSGGNWIAFVPERTLERHSLRLRPDAENHWWGETIEGSIEGIQLAKSQGLKVMLKPHIVLSKREEQAKKKLIHFKKEKEDKTGGASWRGTFSAKKESDWQIFEKDYEAYILTLARVADSLDVDLFCIGTELKKSAKQRSEFWVQLIEKVRAVYHGPLTYSANWDEYGQISFWSKLDYIGVDAYFPVSLAATPKVRRTMRNWRLFLKKLKRVSKTHQRPILITEAGYRNVSFAGKRPWRHDNGGSATNDKAQAHLYEAFFRAVHKKKWVAGSFMWEWFANPKEPGNTSFSPQGKPALKVLEKWYKRR